MITENDFDRGRLQGLREAALAFTEARNIVEAKIQKLLLLTPERDPQTIIDYDLYPASHRPSQLKQA